MINQLHAPDSTPTSATPTVRPPHTPLPLFLARLPRALNSLRLPLPPLSPLIYVLIPALHTSKATTGPIPPQGSCAQVHLPISRPSADLSNTTITCGTRPSAVRSVNPICMVIQTACPPSKTGDYTPRRSLTIGPFLIIKNLFCLLGILIIQPPAPSRVLSSPPLRLIRPHLCRRLLLLLRARRSSPLRHLPSSIVQRGSEANCPRRRQITSKRGCTVTPITHIPVRRRRNSSATLPGSA